jgi:hypothetical protein
MIDTDKYEGHTKESWVWYEFGDGDWILCPLHEDVIATDDWYVDAETGEHIENHHDIWNWDDAILSLQSDCLTGSKDMRCVPSTHRFGKNSADQRLIADAPLLLAEVKRLREGIEHALHIRLRHGQEEGWKELKELIE